MRRAAILLSLLMTLTVASAAPKKKSAPVPVAPDAMPHSMAQFLRGLSRDGARSVTFKATATGTRFFFEEGGGVTVYGYRDGAYVKETFLRGLTLTTAVKRYAKK